MIDFGDITQKLPRNPGSHNWRTRALGTIRKIVVHYDAEIVPAGEDRGLGYDPVQRYVGQARYHMSRNWNEYPGGPIVRGFGLMYHYRVSADGRIWRTQPESLITWHARAANTVGVAICCDLGSGQTPSSAQVAGLKALLDWLCFERPDIPAGRGDVWGHGELHAEGNRTSCPGNMLEWVQAYRKGLIE